MPVTDFPGTNAADWKEQLIRDLKGKPVEDLITHLPDGLNIRPFYTAEDNISLSIPSKAREGWETIAELDGFDSNANQAVLHALNTGADSLLLYITGSTNLASLLKDVEISAVGLHLVTDANPAAKLNELLTLGTPAGGSINFDPLENLARTGNWIKDETADRLAWQALQKENSNGLHTVCVNANIFLEAGATPSLQLGTVLSMLNEYRQWAPSASRAWVNLAVGGDYFTEICKIRAMRLLHAFLSEQYGEPAEPLFIYAETALRNKSTLDHNNNLIRSSTEAMAAALGGADALNIKPFDLKGEPFATRISRYQSLVMQFEGALHQVEDPARGAWFLEDLTRQLAEKGWEWFQRIEAEGGYILSLKTGKLQSWISDMDLKERESFASGTQKLVGVNRYPHPAEKEMKEPPARISVPGSVNTPLSVARLAQTEKL